MEGSVKNWLCKALGPKTLAVLIFAAATLAATANPARSADAAIDKKSAEAPIEIVADRLLSDNNRRTAEFSGNVRAQQADTVILADRLKIYYAAGSGTKNEPGANSLQRIEASGQVTITFDGRVAKTQTAVYTTADRVLVLTGPNSTVSSGRDSVSGSRITFFRQDGRVRVEGGDRKRVTAIIHSGQRGLN